MCDKNKFVYAAIGLVLGLGFALLFFVWTVPEFSNSNYDIGDSLACDNCTSNVQRAVPKDDSQWWYWVARFLSAEDTLAQWIMAFFTVGMTVLTGVALYFIRATTIFTSKTLDEAKSATKAANETILVTRQVGQAQTRAYVAFETMRTEPHYDITGKHIIKWGFSAVWKNHGSTPAVNVKTTSACTTEELPQGFSPTIHETAEFSFISPNQENMGQSWVWEIDKLVKLQQANKEIIFWGRVEYDDVVDTKKRHFNDFCRKMHIIGNLTQPNPGFVVYVDGNLDKYGDCD